MQTKYNWAHLCYICKLVSKHVLFPELFAPCNICLDLFTLYVWSLFPNNYWFLVNIFYLYDHIFHLEFYCQIYNIRWNVLASRVLRPYKIVGHTRIPLCARRHRHSIIIMAIFHPIYTEVQNGEGFHFLLQFHSNCLWTLCVFRLVCDYCKFIFASFLTICHLLYFIVSFMAISLAFVFLKTVSTKTKFVFLCHSLSDRVGSVGRSV